jgi:hypothetical protein
MNKWLIQRILIPAAILCFPMIGKSVEGVKLVCDRPVFNFGTVGQSAVVTNVFTIRNAGDVSFVLHHVQTTCSCTAGKLDKRIIGPGETARLTAVYTAARRKGPQQKKILLIPVDGREPACTLYMEGFVEPPADSD